MASVNFLYRSIKNNAPLNVRLLFRTKDGVDKVYGAKTKLVVSKDYWLNLHLKKNTRDISIKNKQIEIGNELNNIENHILSAFENTSALGVDKSWLTNQLDIYYNPKSNENEYPTAILKYYDYFIEDKKNSIAKQTIKNYGVIKSLLIKYEASRRRQLHVKDIDLAFKNDFQNFCMSEGYSTNYIGRLVYSIKAICTHAKFNGLETSHQLERVKVREEKVENIYLSFEEIAKIEACELELDYLVNARDWLVISCYVGQRVSDLMKMDKTKIRVENGKKLIEFTQKKTGKIMTVPLHPKVLDILDKREGEFPRAITSQNYNNYIKTVCQEAGLNEKVRGGKKVETFEGSKKFRKKIDEYEKWELVSSHIGRRSFATNFYGQIPTSYLIYITGHSTERMFLNYIGKSNKDLALEITNYF
ncbi:phage integrase SAM-like domain-containing protein [Maribacter aestuarii]|uniref:phage integrase SAM-like domain-containing protein n=1 Tax=Maribacter aestuarii TaxID=1130723 RepID=UPI0025A54A43|nr:phage integrase SAM-like domain-containing protein [Maribacter aestuarii]